MPTYYSVRSGHSLELRRGGKGQVRDAVLGLQDAIFKPLKVKFTALSNRIPVWGLPSKGGLAKGILTPEDGVAQIRRAANELGPAADSLPETDAELTKWLVDKLGKHSGLGSEFVAVPDPNEILEGGDLEAELEPVMRTVSDPVGLITMSEGRGYCRLCDKSMKPQGVNGHRKSTRHLTKLREWDEEQRASAVG